MTHKKRRDKTRTTQPKKVTKAILFDTQFDTRFWQFLMRSIQTDTPLIGHGKNLFSYFFPVLFSLLFTKSHFIAPIGSLKPSRADEQLTKKIKDAAEMMEIRLLDHIILTKDSHFSFANEGMLGLEGLQNLKNNLDQFVAIVERDLSAKKNHNKISIEKLAASFGIFSTLQGTQNPDTKPTLQRAKKCKTQSTHSRLT